ncbi:AAA ATPase domain protein [Mycobacterium avium subsp. avium 2285 (R)]|nr:AAA ATPase domain protein [Mycobacterium avium subsp. avium 2285 (R)]
MIGGELLIGRDSELAAIRRALNGADHHRGVVIAGAAGVGKTWLARAALRRAGASGEQIKWIVGTQSAQALPLGAFIGLLGDAMSEPLTSVRRVIETFVARQRRAGWWWASTTRTCWTDCRPWWCTSWRSPAGSGWW